MLIRYSSYQEINGMLLAKKNIMKQGLLQKKLNLILKDYKEAAASCFVLSCAAKVRVEIHSCNVCMIRRYKKRRRVEKDA